MQVHHALPLVLALSASAHADHPTTKDIVTTAVEAGSFSSLAAALEAAHLVDDLQAEGPFTVFAPADEAFGELDPHALRRLLSEENRGELTGLLTFHVVPGTYRAADLASRSFLPTLNGQRLTVSTTDGVEVAGGRVVQADIECSNGVIHVVDSVLMPAQKDLAAVAQQAGSFGTLLAAAQAAGLADALASDGPFTVLAPNDEAFAAIGEDAIASLLQPAARARLQRILQFHVIPGRVYATDALVAGRGQTLADAPVRFTLEDGRLRAGGADVLAADVEASNGVIHVIDRVLMPPAPKGSLVIGYHCESVDAQLADFLGVDAHSAVIVTSVSRSESGLRTADVITHVDGEPYSKHRLTDAKKEAGYGGIVRLTIRRRGEHERVLDCSVDVD